jgi:hypothetical protein
MTARTSIRLLLASGLIALVAACGGAATAGSGDDASQVAETADVVEATPEAAEDAAPQPGTDLNACEIVTAADIETATDTDGIGDGEFESNPTVLSPGHSECTYEGDFGRLIVSLTPEDGENLYDAAAGAYKDAVMMDGVGDGAFYSADNNRAFAWKGNVTIMFTIFVNGDLDAAEVSRDLGLAALAKV